MRSRKRNQSKSTYSGPLVFQICSYLTQGSQTSWQVPKTSYPGRILQGVYNSSGSFLLPVTSMDSSHSGSSRLGIHSFSGKKLDRSAFPRFTEILHPDAVIPAPSTDWTADITSVPMRPSRPIPNSCLSWQGLFHSKDCLLRMLVQHTNQM